MFIFVEIRGWVGAVNRRHESDEATDFYLNITGSAEITLFMVIIIVMAVSRAGQHFVTYVPNDN